MASSNQWELLVFSYLRIGGFDRPMMSVCSQRLPAPGIIDEHRRARRAFSYCPGNAQKPKATRQGKVVTLSTTAPPHILEQSLTIARLTRNICSNYPISAFQNGILRPSLPHSKPEGTNAPAPPAK